MHPLDRAVVAVNLRWLEGGPTVHGTTGTSDSYGSSEHFKGKVWFVVVGVAVLLES